MRTDPLFGLGVEAFEIGLELVLVDPPDAPAPKFYRGQLMASHQRVDLGDADVEVGSDLLQSHESGCDTGPFAGVLRFAHSRSLAKLASVWLDWRALAPTNVERTRGRWMFR